MLSQIELTLQPATLARNFRPLAITAIVMSGIYLGLNHLPRQQVQSNFLFSVEERIPFWIWSIYIYWGALIVSFFVPLCVKNPMHLRNILSVNALSFIFNAMIWTFIPVGYPRPAFPADDPSLAAMIYGRLTQVDTPLNSFPSGHASMMTIVLWIAYALGGRRGALLGGFAVLGLLSIFTTKQHSFLDAAMGILTLALAFILFRARRVSLP